MATHEVLRLPLKRSKTEDIYSRSFCSARAQLEGCLRGRPLNLELLTTDLRPLPESVRRSLLASADVVTRQRVAASLAQPAAQRRC